MNVSKARVRGLTQGKEVTLLIALPVDDPGPLEQPPHDDWLELDQLQVHSLQAAIPIRLKEASSAAIQPRICLRPSSRLAPWPKPGEHMPGCRASSLGGPAIVVAPLSHLQPFQAYRVRWTNDSAREIAIGEEWPCTFKSLEEDCRGPWMWPAARMVRMALYA